MISVEVNFLCDGDPGTGYGDCDECYTTEPGDFNLEEHISEAAVDGGWLFSFSATGEMKCFCYGCQQRMNRVFEAENNPATVLKRRLK